MIRVTLAPEPDTFDRDVRQPGLDAIRELVGAAPLKKRTGPKRKRIAASPEAIPPDVFPPFWRHALEDMLDAYRRLCAFTCLYIEPVTGGASVDHMLPRSTHWDRVYEWSNYRLACARMNSRKGAVKEVLDPFEVEDGWFLLELTSYQVISSPRLDGELARKVERTIDALDLNDDECLEGRGEYVQAYLNGDISLGYLERRAPFIARELRRQERLREEDR